MSRFVQISSFEFGSDDGFWPDCRARFLALVLMSLHVMATETCRHQWTIVAVKFRGTQPLKNGPWWNVMNLQTEVPKSTDDTGNGPVVPCHKEIALKSFRSLFPARRCPPACCAASWFAPTNSKSIYRLQMVAVTVCHSQSDSYLNQYGTIKPND